jgi:uncharacterized membrane protein YdbT with pleckstrin-like domain
MLIEYREIIELLKRAPLFGHLGEPEHNRLAGLFQINVYRDGEVIFTPGSASEAMFIVNEGHVNLLVREEGGDVLFETLQPGDVFGEESLLYDDPRYYSAISSGKTVLLMLSVDHYLAIKDDLPFVEEKLDVLIRSRRLSTQISFPWLREDENVHVMTRRHPVYLWFKMVFPILTGVLLLLVSILLLTIWSPGKPFGWILMTIAIPGTIFWSIWTVIDWRNDYFVLTNKRAAWIEKVAFIYDSRKEAPLSTIMSVGLERSRIGSLFDFADVVVQTYVGTIRLKTLAQGDAIASLIEAYWHTSDKQTRKQEAQAMSQILHEKLNFPWSSDEDTQPLNKKPVKRPAQSTPKEPGFFAWLLSDFIRLRYEQDNAITYRKHWFLLVKRTCLPIVLSVLLLFGTFTGFDRLVEFFSMTTTLVVLFIVLFILFLWVLYQYADWRDDNFKITMDQIIDLDRKPLGKIRRRSAPLENVLSIEYERLGILGVLFNFGTVYITVGNTQLTFDHVYNPSEVQQDIFYRMGERLEELRQFEVEKDRERVSEWIASYHRNLTNLRSKPDDQYHNGQRNK